MRSRYFLSLLLATLLHARPVASSAAPDRVCRAPAWAFIHRLAPVRQDAIGGYDAVSTATTSINGPFTINATVGKSLPSTRLTTTGHVAESWTASPNPVAPGLTMGSSGTITGTPTQAGTFKSVVTAWEFIQSGPSTSATFTFVITGGGTAPVITAAPVSQILPAGTNATLTVAATGTPPPAYQWSLAGTNIPAATNATLLLANIQPSQSGTYRVTITNASGSVSTNATLTVEIPPVITNQPLDQIVTAGGSVNLAAAASGAPLVWQWSFNSNILAGATNPVLTLSPAATGQSGFYSVSASNAVGFAVSQSARLLVVPPAGPAEAPVLSLAPAGSGRLLLGFSALPGYNYSVETSVSLPATSWVPLTNFPASFTGTNLSLPLDSSAGQVRFYRISVQGN